MKLSSGREFEPNGGYIGINERMEVCEGYDDGLSGDYDFSDEPWKPSERVELAEFMIKRWQEYRERYRAS